MIFMEYLPTFLINDMAQRYSSLEQATPGRGRHV